MIKHYFEQKDTRVIVKEQQTVVRRKSRQRPFANAIQSNKVLLFSEKNCKISVFLPKSESESSRLFEDP